MANRRQGIAGLAGLEADVCVVGSGPIGLAVAFDLARRGRRVALIESGGDRPSEATAALSRAHLADVHRHVDVPLACCRALGGNFWIWGGRCVPFNSIDFAMRPHMPDSRWPIDEADVLPFYEAAALHLGCSTAGFEQPASAHAKRAYQGGIELDHLERWLAEPITSRALLRDAIPSTLTIVSAVTVVDIEVEDRRVAALIVADRTGKERYVGALHYVLACGGLETTRLMLVARRNRPGLFGGGDGPLGRYYMGHLSGHVTTVQFADPGFARHFRYRSADREVLRTRLMLAADIQMSEQLPNVAFWPTNPRLADAGHRSGLLSLLFLMISTPFIGKRFISEGIRQMQLSDTPRYPAHLRNVLLDLPATIVHAADLAWQVIGLRRRKPFFFLASADGRYPLHYHGEHRADAASRVMLAADRDPLDMPRLAIDLRFSEADADGIARAHLRLDRGLRAAGLGALDGVDDAGACDRLRNAILAEAHDGFSQLGTTRMGQDRSDGVVDRDCRTFDVKNLWIAGSSVYRTASQANPTFLATALALRLAARLDSCLERVSRPLEVA